MIVDMQNKPVFRPIVERTLRCSSYFPARGLTDERKDLLYKSTLDLSNVSDADKRPNGGSMVSRCVADLKPGVFDAPLRGFGA
jgi:hypothetical protein